MGSRSFEPRGICDSAHYGSAICCVIFRLSASAHTEKPLQGLTQHTNAVCEFRIPGCIFVEDCGSGSKKVAEWLILGRIRVSRKRRE